LQGILPFGSRYDFFCFPQTIDVVVVSTLLRVFLNFLQVVSDVAASANELSNTFVKEGFEKFGRGSKGGRKDELMEVI